MHFLINHSTEKYPYNKDETKTKLNVPNILMSVKDNR